jgi:hypothetical protein
MNQGAFESFYFGTPIVTRVYSKLTLRTFLFFLLSGFSSHVFLPLQVTVCVVTTLAVYLDVVNVLQLYLNFDLVYQNLEVPLSLSLSLSLSLV